MMPETCAVTLLRSQWKALESVLDERTPLSALSDSKKLAESIRNRQIMDSPCSYGCGFYSDALNTLGDHYKICPETPVKCNNDCGEQIARKSLLDHNKHCDHVEQECHRGCGARVIRKRLLSGEHDKTCPKLTIPCNYCQKSFERQEISLHERTCHNRPAPCRYCGKKMLFSESKTHLDHCDKTMPFTLTDHTYIIQPESTGLVFQREGEAVCSHICIRESAHILNSWMSGRSGEMRMNLGILDKKELTFSLGNNITTLMLDDASLKIFSDSYNISNFEVFCINENGNKLFTLYSSDAREAQVCKSRVDLSHSCVLLTREILAKQPQHDILYLIISLRSHTTLFPAKAKQLQDKQATPQKKSWWSR
ncbi:hypothetical protein [Parendozoicomonas haliclonae]|nr:hypothetical protein [Parendozoicomonas haliclonae]